MRLKRARHWLHARQPWTPKPASGADAAAQVAWAWAWRLGPSGGCGKRGRGAGRRGAFRDLGTHIDGPPLLSLLPGYAAWLEARLLAASPGRATSPPGRAPLPDVVPVTGAPRVRRHERSRTRARKSEKSRHGRVSGHCLGLALALLVLSFGFRHNVLTSVETQSFRFTSQRPELPAIRDRISESTMCFNSDHLLIRPYSSFSKPRINSKSIKLAFQIPQHVAKRVFAHAPPRRKS
jgi:hypothetical protein